MRMLQLMMVLPVVCVVNCLAVRHRLRHSSHRSHRYKNYNNRHQLNRDGDDHSSSSSRSSTDYGRTEEDWTTAGHSRHTVSDVMDNREKMNWVFARMQSSGTQVDEEWRKRNEPLCAVERNTVHMNTPTEEFDPPFLIEIRCRNVAEYRRHRGRTSLQPQTCVNDLLRCVQLYKSVHFSRRRVGHSRWQPFSLQNVAVGCECMWPVERYGPQHHQEL